MDRHHAQQNPDNGEEISKKDVLTLTGISYGQFYRWKRMGLIPEAWFRRRSAFTGQETFLPRQQVLERIEQIQTLREQYSLDEIVEILAPNAAHRRYAQDEIARLPWATPAVLALFPGTVADGFDFTDLLCLALIERLHTAPDITSAQVRLAAETLRARFTGLGEGAVECHLLLWVKDGVSIVVLLCGSCLPDLATRTVCTVDLNRLLDEVKVHLRMLAE
jgi:DNA-binding transcriptional MerR regulator